MSSSSPAFKTAAFEFTGILDGCRYWAGLVAVAVTFSIFCPYLLSLHVFLPLWRRLGRGPTVAAHVGLSSALVSRVLSSPIREAIMNALGGDLGFPKRFHLAMAAILAGASLWLKFRWMKDMDVATALGWKGELERGGKGGELITGGVYSVVRHPRYSQIIVGMAAIALFSNHGAVWFSAAAAVLILTLVAGLEERELAQRFGAAHAAYVAAVPHLFCPVPFFPLPPSLRDKYAADNASTNGTNGDADGVRGKKAMLRPSQASGPGPAAAAAAAAVEKAFADDDTEDAVPSAGFGSHPLSPPLSPDPYAFSEHDEQLPSPGDGGSNVEAMEVEDAAAMFPDADELFSAMMSTPGTNVPSSPSTSSGPASARDRVKKTAGFVE